MENSIGTRKFRLPLARHYLDLVFTQNFVVAYGHAHITEHFGGLDSRALRQRDAKQSMMGEEAALTLFSPKKEGLVIRPRCLAHR